jgi:hypothetical protein
LVGLVSYQTVFGLAAMIVGICCATTSGDANGVHEALDGDELDDAVVLDDDNDGADDDDDEMRGEGGLFSNGRDCCRISSSSSSSSEPMAGMPICDMVKPSTSIGIISCALPVVDDDVEVSIRLESDDDDMVL